MKIAILSNGDKNYSTQRLVEEAEKRGHEVEIVKYKNCFVSIEQGNNAVYYKGKPLPKYDAVIPRIANYMTKYGTTIVRQLEMQGEYVLSKSIAITRARNKLRSMQLLAKYNIDIPKTVVSRNTTDIDELLEQLGERVKTLKNIFPNGVNISLVEHRGTNHIFVTTFERGAGITPSCGTAMTSSATTAALLGLCSYDSEITVENRGGAVRCICSRKEGLKTTLIGNASFTERGTVEVIGKGFAFERREVISDEIEAWNSFLKNR